MDFADRNFDARTSSRDGFGRMQVQRLAARNIAGSLAMVDGKEAKSPFVHIELTKIYQQEQAYRVWLEQQISRQASRGMER